MVAILSRPHGDNIKFIKYRLQITNSIIYGSCCPKINEVKNSIFNGQNMATSVTTKI